MLGARIAALRRQAGQSQAELAAALKISPSAVGMYEQGRREPSVQMLVAMAKHFHVTTDYLLTGECCSVEDRQKARQVLDSLLLSLEVRLARRDSAFSGEELAAVLAAMLRDA